MVSKYLTSAAFFGVTGVLAFPGFPHPHSGPPGGGSDPPGHEFVPAGPFDSRSPCPGLNAMSNHNYLPHNGLNLSYPQINEGAKAAFNFADGVFLKPFLAVNETYKLSTTGNPLTFNLQDLARHNTIEVDGSITRQDLFLGDDYIFSLPVWNPVKKDLGIDDSNPNGLIGVEQTAKARANRQVAARAENLNFTGGAHQIQATIATNALWLITTWDFTKGAARTGWTEVFLAEDRIPFELGYPNTNHIRTQKFLDQLDKQITNATAALGFPTS